MGANARRIISTTGALALFDFAFLGGEYFFDSVMGTMVDAQAVVLSQNLVLGASVVGFLLFPLQSSRLRESARRVVALVEMTLLIGCLCMVGICHVALQTQIAGCIAFFLLGNAGGSIHWFAAASYFKSPHLACFTGIAYAIGLLLQFAVYSLAANRIASVALLSCAIAGFAAFVLKNIADASFPKVPCVPPDTPEHHQLMRNVACLIGVIALMTCLFGTLDNIITLANASGSIDIATWPRLLLAASGLLAGFLFDLAHHRFMTPIAFCVALLSSLAILVLETNGGLLACLCIFYLSSGFYVVYFTSRFFMLAPYMKIPQLWAGMGRAINNATAVLITVPSLMLTSKGNTSLIIAVDLLVFVGIVILLFASGGFPETRIEVRRTGTSSEDDAAKTATFSAEYHLTQREQQVLSYLVEGKTDDEIAQQLFISSSTVRFHVGNILKKTGCSTRVEAARMMQTFRFY